MNSERHSRRIVGQMGKKDSPAVISLIRGDTCRQDCCAMFDLKVNDTIVTYNVGLKESNSPNFLKFNYFQLKKIEKLEWKNNLYIILLYLLMKFFVNENRAGAEIQGILLPEEEILFFNRLPLQFLRNCFSTVGKSKKAKQDMYIMFCNDETKKIISSLR